MSKYRCPNCDGESQSFRVLISATADMDANGAIEYDTDSELTRLDEYGVLCADCGENFEFSELEDITND